jgi:hypothetical protein
VSASAAAADKAARTDGEDRDAAAAGATAKPALGHARGMTAVDDANDRRARPIDVGRDAALHVATDARFHVTTGESLVRSTRPQRRPRTSAPSTCWLHRSASACRRPAPTA